MNGIFDINDDNEDEIELEDVDFLDDEEDQTPIIERSDEYRRDDSGHQRYAKRDDSTRDAS